MDVVRESGCGRFDIMALRASSFVFTTGQEIPIPSIAGWSLCPEGSKRPGTQGECIINTGRVPGVSHWGYVVSVH